MCKKFLSEFSFYFSYMKVNFRHLFFGSPGISINIFTIQADDSVIRGYFYFRIIDYILDNKSVIDLPYDFKENDLKNTRILNLHVIVRKCVWKYLGHLPMEVY